MRRVVEAVAVDPDREDLLREYPELEPEDIREALAYAAASLDIGRLNSGEIAAGSRMPCTAATILRRAGFDAVHAGEIGLAEAEDSEIIRIAAREDRVVVTLDADFHMHLAWARSRWLSVIRIRIEGFRGRGI